ncbi:M50 family metallopeptidase [Pseudonocardia sp. GCM10023141]|uniref:M50 family metallopeptidase n=1 Tax=Pseudonocardia sp. GCM10023141 TaxID=3252653 RepID=UPI00360B6358
MAGRDPGRSAAGAGRDPQERLIMTATFAATRENEVVEHSERWVTAVHEAGHAITAEYLGYQVDDCRVRTDTTGNTRHNAEGTAHAVVAVAGERAARIITGSGGGCTEDYCQAEDALSGSGRDIAWAEHQADDAIWSCRREITNLARRLYYRGRR